MERVPYPARTSRGSGRGRDLPSGRKSKQACPPGARLLVTLLVAATGLTACADSESHTPLAPTEDDTIVAMAASASATSSPVVSRHASSMCLDSDGGAADIRPCDGSSSQQFTFASDGTVRVNGRCLATGSSRAPRGDRVTYASCTGAPNQKWTRTGSNEIRGINGFCVDIYRRLTTSRTPVIVWECHGGTNQKWKVATTSTSPAPPPPTAAGGTDHRGRVLFTESFDDGSLGSRGWYDVDRPRITTNQKAPGSSGGAFECRFRRGATECEGGVPGRHLFDAVDQLYISYWVKFGDGWVGSGRSYHPHEFHLLNNLEGKWTAPAYTRLTLYVEHVNGRPRVALQDGANVDNRCILRNDNKLIGCLGKTILSYPFSENRSVAACNGLVGPVDGRDCYSLGSGRWYSARSWKSTRAIDDGNWHFVETYIRLNSVSGGRGSANGIIRQWVDGQRTLDVSGVLFRTGEHPSMRINQVLFAPYIGDGSPADQTVWYDQVTFAEGRLP